MGVTVMAGRALAIMIVAVGPVVACAVESDDPPVAEATTTEVPASEDEASEDEATTTEAPTQDVYAIGETAHTSVFDVTVHQVVDPWESTNQFETPAEGHRYVAVEASLTNTEGDELETWSSLLGAEMTDNQGRPWNPAFAGTELPALDGDVGRGMTRRGWVVFEVTADATGFMLRIKGELTATGSLFAL